MQDGVRHGRRHAVPGQEILEQLAQLDPQGEIGHERLTLHQVL